LLLISIRVVFQTQLFNYGKIIRFLKDSMLGQPLWYASMWYSVAVLSQLVTIGAPQVRPVILVDRIP
jgi:hypothetical protein